MDILYVISCTQEIKLQITLCQSTNYYQCKKSAIYQRIGRGTGILMIEINEIIN